MLWWRGYRVADCGWLRRGLRAAPNLLEQLLIMVPMRICQRAARPGRQRRLVRISFSCTAISRWVDAADDLDVVVVAAGTQSITILHAPSRSVLLRQCRAIRKFGPLPLWCLP